MPFDFFSPEQFPAEPTQSARARRGLCNHLAGSAAEDAVARAYCQRGYQIIAKRWRGLAGEIDLIAAKGDDLAIVEVKSGATHDSAAGHLSQRQMKRIGAAAEDFLFGTWLVGRSASTEVDMRFDLALVDRIGQIEICEAAFFL